MSYAATAALQQAVYAALSADAQVVALSAGAVYDALPEGPVPPLYVTLGEETVRDRSDGTGHGAQHDVRVDVVSQEAGYHGAKALAAAVSDALLAADLTLSRGTVRRVAFLRARARRRGTDRRIETWFRIRVDT